MDSEVVKAALRQLVLAVGELPLWAIVQEPGAANLVLALREAKKTLDRLDGMCEKDYG